MKGSRWPLILLVLAIGGAALGGFARLFVLRFQAGDVYPPYSSLRADPLGTKVLYDALHEAPDLTVDRNFRSLDKIQHPETATIFYAGARTGWWDAGEAAGLEALARAGARVVVTFLPTEEVPDPGQEAREKKERAARKAKHAKEDEDDEATAAREFSEIAKAWGFTVAYRTAAKPGTDASDKRVAQSQLAATEPELSWHTTLYFRKPASTWHVLYRSAGLPVMLDRTIGRGSVVVAADSFFLSNEAMRTERASRLLAWLLGPRPRIVFDETHLGVAENPGIATLIRQYKLQGLLAAIAVLAGLFVWQTASPFLPAAGESRDDQIVVGKDSFAGFVSFLRRGIAPSALLGICLEQWKKSAAARPGKPADTLARIEAAATLGSREPVIAYRMISQILAEKK